jgi:hypothetical protein
MVIELILFLIVLAFLLFLFNRFFPGDENIKALVNYIVYFVIGIAVILFILDLVGLYSFRGGRLMR